MHKFVYDFRPYAEAARMMKVSLQQIAVWVSQERLDFTIDPKTDEVMIGVPEDIETFLRKNLLEAKKQAPAEPKKEFVYRRNDTAKGFVEKKAAALELGVSTGVVSYLIKRGDLKHKCAFGKTYVTRASLEKCKKKIAEELAS